MGNTRTTSEPGKCMHLLGSGGAREGTTSQRKVRGRGRERVPVDKPLSQAVWLAHFWRRSKRRAPLPPPTIHPLAQREGYKRALKAPLKLDCGEWALFRLASNLRQLRSFNVLLLSLSLSLSLLSLTAKHTNSSNCYHTRSSLSSSFHSVEHFRMPLLSRPKGRFPSHESSPKSR